MIDFQLRFFWNFIILYALAMSTTAIAMVIGSSVTDPKLAIEFLPMTLVPQIMFAGFFIAPDLIPVWLRWLQYLMPLTYATRLYLEKEFGRDCGSVRGNTNCQTILDSVGIESDDVWWYWVALLSLFVGLRLLALLLLRKKASKY
jgi:ABC-type multidrug transport system permease subunit